MDRLEWASIVCWVLRGTEELGPCLAAALHPRRETEGLDRAMGWPQESQGGLPGVGQRLHRSPAVRGSMGPSRGRVCTDGQRAAVTPARVAVTEPKRWGAAWVALPWVGESRCSGGGSKHTADLPGLARAESCSRHLFDLAPHPGSRHAHPKLSLGPAPEPPGVSAATGDSLQLLGALRAVGKARAQGPA